MGRRFAGFKKVALDEVRRAAVVRDVQNYILQRLERQPALRRHLSRDTAPALNLLHIKVGRPEWPNYFFFQFSKLLDSPDHLAVILLTVYA